MKSALKNLILGALRRVILGLNKTYLGRHLFQQFIEIGMSISMNVRHGLLNMVFATPNILCRYRAESFSSKEPETLTWLESIPEGAVVPLEARENPALLSAAATKTAREFENDLVSDTSERENKPVSEVFVTMKWRIRQAQR